MIPLVMPPLSNLRVVITRPAQQATHLSDAIMKRGGDVVRFPVLEIKARHAVLTSLHHDLVILVSANAVIHGASLLRQLNNTAAIAVIGNATAAALKQLGFDAAIIAPSPFNSEALLQHQALREPPKSILLIKGSGGRDVLRETLTARGAQVEVVEVYERIAATIDVKSRSDMQRALKDAAVDVISITSVDIAHAIPSFLDKNELLLAQQCAVLAGSARIAAQLPAMGWRGEMIVSDSPDDESMLAALTRWHTRSRN